MDRYFAGADEGTGKLTWDQWQKFCRIAEEDQKKIYGAWYVQDEAQLKERFELTSNGKDHVTR